MYKKSSFPLKIVYRTKNLGNLVGMGVKEVWKSRWEGGGGSKNVAIREGGVDFFWNNPLMVLVLVLVLMKSC